MELLRDNELDPLDRSLGASGLHIVIDPDEDRNKLASLVLEDALREDDLNKYVKQQVVIATGFIPISRDIIGGVVLPFIQEDIDTGVDYNATEANLSHVLHNLSTIARLSKAHSESETTPTYSGLLKSQIRRAQDLHTIVLEGMESQPDRDRAVRYGVGHVMEHLAETLYAISQHGNIVLMAVARDTGLLGQYTDIRIHAEEIGATPDRLVEFDSQAMSFYAAAS